MDSHFREAAPADLDTLVAFMRDLYVFDHVPFDEQRARRTMSGLLRDPSLGRVWIILEGSEPAGYAAITLGYSLQYGGRDAFIDELFIREDRRGRGLGRGALAFVEERCRAFGVRTLHLAVDRENQRAQEVYEQFGFADQGFHLMSKPIAG